MHPRHHGIDCGHAGGAVVAPQVDADGGAHDRFVTAQPAGVVDNGAITAAEKARAAMYCVRKAEQHGPRPSVCWFVLKNFPIRGASTQSPCPECRASWDRAITGKAPKVGNREKAYIRSPKKHDAFWRRLNADDSFVS